MLRLANGKTAMVGGTLPSFIFAEAAAVTVSSILERFSRSGLLKSNA